MAADVLSCRVRNCVQFVNNLCIIVLQQESTLAGQLKYLFTKLLLTKSSKIYCPSAFFASFRKMKAELFSLSCAIVAALANLTRPLNSVDH